MTTIAFRTLKVFAAHYKATTKICLTHFTSYHLSMTTNTVRSRKTD